MSKTIMVSNEVYDKLKILKNGSSFSEIITSLIDKSSPKLGEGLRSCLGLIPEDKEWKEISKDLKKGWKKWTKKYA